MVLAFFFLLFSSFCSASFHYLHLYTFYPTYLHILKSLFTYSKQHLFTFYPAYLQILSCLFPAYFPNKSIIIKLPIVRLICFIHLPILHQKTKIKYPQHLVNRYCGYSSLCYLLQVLFQQTAIKQYYYLKSSRLIYILSN